MRGGRRGRQILAWCVHLYTALGLVAAAGMAVLLVDGSPAAFRGAFALMLVATVIDATDGTLARRVRVKEVLPGFDGRRLDDLIDFLTYAALPLLLIWRADLLPPGQEAWLLVPLLASAYGFSQVAAKTDDGFFLGFPSYWNVVAFYLYVLRPPQGLALGLVLGFAFLIFAPTRYLYPSQRGRLNVLTTLLGAVWAGLLTWILFLLPTETPADPRDVAFVQLVTALSLFYPVYYLVVSWTLSVVLWLRANERPPAAGRGYHTQPQAAEKP